MSVKRSTTCKSEDLDDSTEDPAAHPDNAGRGQLDLVAAPWPLRPFLLQSIILAIGRRNWTFAGSDAGGHRAAAVYTLIETCKMNDIHSQSLACRHTGPAH